MATEQTRAPTASDDARPHWSLHRGDVLDVYVEWPRPALIVSDGAYGVGGFPGDPRTPSELANWYAPHIENWSKFAHPATTLWFWNTEIGWANVHPLLVEAGWDYVQSIVWDKGLSHIAGNVNGDTIRQFPVTTEVCVFYRRRLEFETSDGVMSAKRWLRHEWQRAGLPLSRANEACGVANAATRKYLTQDWLWYFPPPEMMERLVRYANRHGDSREAPFYCIEGNVPVTAAEWSRLRHVWSHAHGLTNVWAAPPLHGDERLKGNGVRSAPRVHRPGPNAAVHLNQKPVEFMQRIIAAVTAPGDSVWEPFGGLCSGAVAAIMDGRQAFAAEQIEHFADVAEQRLTQVATE
ncbi:DNA methyltransferase [Candidatus Poriferisodalis sp.]|uniref:DNA methyltransferase n=1 Tax=Candidatus Poriferisodalis sp. TaxID=3101277 RepID=UPI003B523F98